MAIGDNGYSNSENNNEGNNGRLYDQTYYSRYNIKNKDKQLSISFRSGLLILEIDEINQENYKRTALSTIYLSPAKAAMFAERLTRFKAYRAGDDIKENVAFGVTGGMKEKVSYIGVHTNEDKDVFVTIGKFDDAGNIVESTTMALNKDYNYSIEWQDISQMKLERVFNNDLELDQLIWAVSDFARFMSGAAGYSGADLTRYDHARIMNKMNPIYDALHIERRSYGNSYSNHNNDFLSNSSTSSRSTSIDEVSNLLG